MPLPLRGHHSAPLPFRGHGFGQPPRQDIAESYFNVEIRHIEIDNRELAKILHVYNSMLTYKGTQYICKPSCLLISMVVFITVGVTTGIPVWTPPGTEQPLPDSSEIPSRMLPPDGSSYYVSV